MYSTINMKATGIPSSIWNYLVYKVYIDGLVGAVCDE